MRILCLFHIGINAKKHQIGLGLTNGKLVVKKQLKVEKRVSKLCA